MSAQDYPITFPYGATDGVFYGPAAVGKPTYIGPYHRGVDRVMPIGTPVVVNGVQIGLSGATGEVSGPHLHVGCFLTGNHDTNPGNGGFNFRVAVVSQVGSDSENGNWVKLAADGALWVYLHLSKQTCVVGRVLAPPAPQSQGVPMVDGNTINEIFVGTLFRLPSAEEVAHYNGKVSAQDLGHALNSSGERAGIVSKYQLGLSASVQLATMQTNLDTLYAQIKTLSDDNVALKGELAKALLPAVAPKETPAPVPQNTMEPAVVTPNWLTKLLAKFIK